MNSDLARKPPAIETNAAALTVLTISSLPEDHETLRSMLPAPSWRLRRAITLESARRMLREGRFDVVLCERQLLSGGWRDLLPNLFAMKEPPALIVASKLADERFWAEALNLGAYDVLEKPFDATEVMRVLTCAAQYVRRRAAGVRSAVCG